LLDSELDYGAEPDSSVLSCDREGKSGWFSELDRTITQVVPALLFTTSLPRALKGDQPLKHPHQSEPEFGSESLAFPRRFE